MIMLSLFKLSQIRSHGIFSDIKMLCNIERSNTEEDDIDLKMYYVTVHKVIGADWDAN